MKPVPLPFGHHGAWARCLNPIVETGHYSFQGVHQRKILKARRSNEDTSFFLYLVGSRRWGDLDGSVLDATLDWVPLKTSYGVMCPTFLADAHILNGGNIIPAV